MSAAVLLLAVGVIVGIVALVMINKDAIGDEMQSQQEAAGSTVTEAAKGALETLDYLEEELITKPLIETVEGLRALAGWANRAGNTVFIPTLEEQPYEVMGVIATTSESCTGTLYQKAGETAGEAADAALGVAQGAVGVAQDAVGNASKGAQKVKDGVQKAKDEIESVVCLGGLFGGTCADRRVVGVDMEVTVGTQTISKGEYAIVRVLPNHDGDIFYKCGDHDEHFRLNNSDAGQPTIICAEFTDSGVMFKNYQYAIGTESVKGTGICKESEYTMEEIEDMCVASPDCLRQFLDEEETGDEEN